LIEPSSTGRDVRLDLFRGVANWAIFLDHTPHEILSWMTMKNYGFRDAADLFVFISGYTAAQVFVRVMHERGYAAAVARVVKRVFQLYAAHLAVLLVYVGVIVWVSYASGDPDDVNQFNVAAFADAPLRALGHALVLGYKPINLDVLPLDMALLVAFVPGRWLLAKLKGLEAVFVVIALGAERAMLVSTAVGVAAACMAVLVRSDPGTFGLARMGAGALREQSHAGDDERREDRRRIVSAEREPTVGERLIE
jgi:hypothetical protein